MKNLIKVFCLATGLFLISNTADAQYRTGVYVNNQELDYQTLSNLQQYTGVLVQGYYYIDAYGNFGIVGYYPALNLAQAINTRQQSYPNSYQQRYNQNNSNYSYNNTGDYRDENAVDEWGKEGNTTYWRSKSTKAGVTRSGNDIIMRDSEGKVIYTNF